MAEYDWITVSLSGGTTINSVTVKLTGEPNDVTFENVNSNTFTLPYDPATTINIVSG